MPLVPLEEYQPQDTKQPPSKLVPLEEYKPQEKEEDVGFGTNTYRTLVGAARDVLSSTLDFVGFSKKFSPTEIGKAIGTARKNNDVDALNILNNIIEQENIYTVASKNIPEIKEPEKTAGKIARDVAGFGASYAALAKNVGVTTAKKLPTILGLGVAAENIAFSPDEERLSNLIESVPALRNPFTEFLQADPDDNEALARFKMSLESVGLALPVEALFRFAGKIKTSKELDKKLPEDIETEKILKTEIEDPAIKKEKELPTPDVAPSDVVPTLKSNYERFIDTPDFQPEFTIDPLKPELPKYAENINLKRIDAPIENKQKIIDLVAEYQPSIIAAKNVTKFGTDGQELKALADETGLDFDTLKNLQYKDLSGEKRIVFNAPIAYKTRQMHLDSLAEVTKLSKLMKDPEKATDKLRFQFDEAVTRHVALLEKLVEMTAEAGRTLGSFRQVARSSEIEQSKAISKYFQENKGKRESLDAIADAITQLEDPAKVSKFLKDTYKPSGLDMIQEAWINSLLSAPPTHLVNMIGNALNIGMSAGEQVTAASFGLLKRAKETDRVTFKEVGARLIGNVLGFIDGLKAGTKALIDEDYLADPFLKVELARKKAIPGLAGKIIRTPTRFLGAEDLFFKGINYRQELMGLATRQALKEGKKGFNAVRKRVNEIVNNPKEQLPDLDMKSVDYARYQTYNNPLGKFGQSLQEILTQPGFKLGRFIAPFIRTPINIIKYAFERTPAGTVTERYKNAIKAGGAEADIARAKIGFTGAVMSALGLYANQGLITGRGPEDPRERAVLRETGWQEYSVKIGDEYISYQRFEPFGILLGLTADFVNAANMVADNKLIERTLNQEKEDEELTDDINKMSAYLLASFADNITNKTYLRGLSDLIKAIDDPERYGGRYITNFLSSPIPNVVGYVRRYDDPVVRDVRGLQDALMNKIPGMSKSLPPRRNVFGDPIIYTPGAAPESLGKIGEVFSPARKSEITNDLVFNEFQRVGYAPSMPQRSIKGVPLTSEQYEYMLSLQQVYRTKEQIEDEIKSPLWNTYTDFEKQEIFKDILQRNQKEARDETFFMFPEIEQKYNTLKEKQSGVLE